VTSDFRPEVEIRQFRACKQANSYDINTKWQCRS